MSKEAMKLAIQLRDTASGYWTENEIPIIEKLIELLAQTQEPIVGTKTWFKDGKVVTQHLTAKDIYKEQEQEPVGKLQEPTAERAWFTIAELNAWADKKLSENPHWVMPKDEAPPQRTWVGLTDEDVFAVLEKLQNMYHRPPSAIFAQAIEAKLKQKNGYAEEKNT